MGVFGGWEDTKVFGAKVSSETCWRCCTRENVQMLGISLGPLPPARFKVELAFILEQLAMRVKNKVHQAQLWPPRGALGGQLALLDDLHRTIQRLQQIREG